LFLGYILISCVASNDLCYPLVGETRERHLDRTSLELRKLLENAASPNICLHALLGADDLLGSEEIQSVHLAEALQYRPKLMTG